MRLNQVTVAVSNIEEAIVFYATLGLKPIVKSLHYARFVCPEGDNTFSVHLGAVGTNQSTVVYFENDRLDELVKQLMQGGCVFESLPADQPWLWREARLCDPSGNPICLYQAGENRLHPPWRLPESME